MLGALGRGPVLACLVAPTSNTHGLGRTADLSPVLGAESGIRVWAGPSPAGPWVASPPGSSPGSLCCLRPDVPSSQDARQRDWGPASRPRSTSVTSLGPSACSRAEAGDSGEAGWTSGRWGGAPPTQELARRRVTGHRPRWMRLGSPFLAILEKSVGSESHRSRVSAWPARSPADLG